MNISTQRSNDASGLHMRSPLNGSSTVPPSSRSNNSNPLTSKITGILASSFADLEIRDALDTLDTRDVQNTPETRRNLRLNVEREIIQCNADVIDDFGQVSKQLQNVGSALASLQANCAALRTHINNARVETAPMLDEASTLLKRQTEIQNKQRLLFAFRQYFQLTPDELANLTSSGTPITDAFFANLVKAKAIHRDSQLLLSTANQRLGLEILENISKTLNAAFQRLFRWLQREFRALEVLENPRLTFSIRRALLALAERPTLFQGCLDAFAEAREQTLQEALFKALTGEAAGEGGTVKPIEFSAHEPLRYVGDMLAWAHSTTVSEREALEVLFVSEGDEIARGIQEGFESEPWSRSEDGQVFDARKALGQLVNRNLAGVTGLLRQRIEQVIKTHEEPVLEYKIANLIVFYRNIFRKLLDSDGDFIRALNDLEQAAISQFRVAMKYHITSVQGDQLMIPEDLSAPDFLGDALEELKSLLKSYDTSVANADDEGTGLTLLFEEALDPFVDSCETLSETLRTPLGSIFAINCQLACRRTLSNFPFTEEKIAELNEIKNIHCDGLIEHQYRFFLNSSGLRPLLNALFTLSPKDAQNPAAILRSTAFASEPLLAASRKLDQFLPSALIDALESLKKLQNSSLAHEVTNKAAKRFCDDFESVQSAIVAADEERAKQEAKRTGSDDEQASSLREMFPRTSEEIRILLS